ncbi:MAG TPA: NADH/ubiquinone/plastoquinone (complex I), partial [Candidatus Atribacteria bacterium]|nr:NADH/ubiquinone/plastoquinone (complex I) [Candidatus Atribacteria bacterium]
PCGFTPFFSGILSKLGIYALFVSIFSIPLFKTISNIYNTKIFGLFYPFYIIAFLGAITAFLGAVLAFFEDDAKKLLAFSSISQLGYIITGLFIGTSLGVGGALFHALNHALFKGMLFLAIASVIYRTNTRKLSEMGGLLPNMPVTFIAVLGGIIALAGIPPSGGFASKWMLYEALISRKMVFMATLLFLATTASFMYVFRLIHSIFLGQRPVKFATIKEVPLPMQIVMMVFLGLTYIFGIFPGWVLNIISKILVNTGFSPLKYTDTQILSPLGSWNAFWVFILLGWGFAFALLIFFFGAPSRKVSKLDTFASGEILGEDVPYHYSYYFYRPIEEVILPYLKLSAHKIYETISSFIVKRSGTIRLWYSGDLGTYVVYFIVFIFFTLIFSKLIV